VTTVPTTPDNPPALAATEAAELAIPEATTGEIVGIVLDAAAARVLTDRIRGLLTTAYQGLIAAFHGRAWAVLGYETWDAYCKAEFKDAGMVRLDPNQRREVVVELREAGMSTRAISSGLSVSQSTVVNDLSTEQKYSVEPTTITSLDGRERPARRPGPTGPVVAGEPAATPRPAHQKHRRPLPEQCRDVMHQLTKITEGVARVIHDDRFAGHAEQLAERHHRDLAEAAAILNDALDAMPR
jgi:hypothetical protein